MSKRGAKSQSSKRDPSFDRPYEPGRIEEKWYHFWEQHAYFVADNTSEKEPYVIMMPPPNITGALHLGHAVPDVIQDILIRWKRMMGLNTLWLPGTDHAGIATQNVVEKELQKEGTTRHKLGREKFVERVWEWRQKYGQTILMQKRRLGISCDWSRERFTMDEKLSRAVREVFVRLYEEGLIYRGDYLINWCPRCESALSDLEVDHIEKEARIWRIHYPLEDGGGVIEVATTRPETMLGDTAVAVHPDDERYQAFVGRKIRLPLIDRVIPIIADTGVDPEFGSGAVKITPGHDFNDFEVGRRHKLEIISVFDKKARVHTVFSRYGGLERFEARKKILQDLKSSNLLSGEEHYKTSIGHCSRCDSIVEPRHSTQWFVKAERLAKPAIEAVRNGEVRIIPEGWAKTYFNWMGDIKDWCISRQIWWGHRIPAWYCAACSKITVSKTDPVRCAHCKSQKLEQDPDVLDTWFSSGLWPFSTLGWPERTLDLKIFYPSTVMETGFDILFFWVARMMMLGIHFMKQPPFKTVYLHAMVRDEKGQKMSKSRGNVIDPLELMNELGADALRFTLASLVTPGRDIKLSKDRVEGYRNFINKLWNATRFTLMNIPDDFKLQKPDLKNLTRVDRWLLTCFYETVDQTQKKLEAFKFNEAAQTVYQFSWRVFCDWYIELSKTTKQTRNTLVYVLKELLKLLHPFIPFVTEELWHALPLQEEESIMIAPYPVYENRFIDEEAKAEIEQMMAVVSYIRNVRGEHQLSPSKKFHATLVARNKKVSDVLERERPSIENLARLSTLKIMTGKADTRKMSVGTVGFAEILIPMTELFDLAEEKKRLEKQFHKVSAELASIEARLSQKSFVERAPKAVVEKERKRQKELSEQVQKMKVSLTKLESL